MLWACLQVIHSSVVGSRDAGWRLRTRQLLGQLLELPHQIGHARCVGAIPGQRWRAVDAAAHSVQVAGAARPLAALVVRLAHDSGCLEGITRKTTLELSAELGLPAHVEKVTADQLRDADEAFITSTAGGIMPINSVDDIVFGGTGGPGPLTATLHNLYWEKRWDGWLATPVDYDTPVNTESK